MFSAPSKLTKQQQFALMEHLTERKHSICLSCDAPEIVSLDEADVHRRRGHACVDYYDTKAHPVN